MNVNAKIFELNIPLLMSIKILTKLKALLGVTKDTIASRNAGRKVIPIRKHGHFFMKSPTLVPFTPLEL